MWVVYFLRFTKFAKGKKQNMGRKNLSVKNKTKKKFVICKHWAKSLNENNWKFLRLPPSDKVIKRDRVLESSNDWIVLKLSFFRIQN